jgi:hypothetical protein
MRRTSVILSGLPILVCLAAISCTKSRPASNPTTTTSPAADDAPPSATESASGDDSDVGMSFKEPEEKGEANDRTPPPTKSWKPMDKEKPAKNARQPAAKDK